MFDAYLAFLRYLRQVWLHRRVAAAITIVAAAAGWFGVSQLPDVYRADARLYVDTASMLNRLLDGVALDSSSVDQEFLQLARRSLLSRPNLERIARETDLQFTSVGREEQERRLQQLASSIEVRGQSTRHRGPENIFTLEYNHRDPEHALEVVRLVNEIFIDSVLGLSRQDSEKTDRFLTRQITEYERRLETAEERRRDFRQQNAGLLPGEGQNYFSMLHQGRERLRAARLDLTRAERTRDDLREQLQALGGGEELVQSLPVGQMDPEQVRRSSRLRELEASLASLRERYTDNHPDVQHTLRRIENLREQGGESLDTALGSDQHEERAAMTPADFRLQELRGELARAHAAVASERATVEEYEARLKELEASVHTIPIVEAEMARLNRDYDIVRRQYEALVSRRESASMSREADLTADEGMFRVIESPHVGSRPVSPDRPLLATAVLGGAMAAGGGLAFLLALLAPTYSDVRQLRDATGVHVLGRVGRVRSRREIVGQWLTYGAYGLLLAGLLSGYLYFIVTFA